MQRERLGMKGGSVAIGTSPNIDYPFFLLIFYPLFVIFLSFAVPSSSASLNVRRDIVWNCPTRHIRMTSRTCLIDYILDNETV